MDPLFHALSLYKRRRYEEAVNKCTECLEKNPYDKVSFPNELFKLDIKGVFRIRLQIYFECYEFSGSLGAEGKGSY